MPTFDTKTLASHVVWTAPDGQRTIYEVTMDYNGKTFVAKTFSKDIAVVGWTGSVETYDKTSARGTETYVKQPQKEGGFTGGGGGFKGGGKSGGDPFAMYLSYAKDIAVAMIDDKGELDQDKYLTVLANVTAGGHELYGARPGGEHDPSKAPEAPSLTTPITKSNLDQIFDVPDDSPPFTEADMPWGPNG